MSVLDIRSHPDLLVGLASPDDAGVFRINSTIALIQTLDFLTPVTDTPYEFGQIAAANSLSDVYAMGGTPLTVMNIVCFPSCDLPEEMLLQTLKGGQDKINESGATLVGGHSVEDSEFKYGLSVTGVVHPDQVLTNSGCCIGDVVILTKPVGTGVISTAIKGGLADADDVEQAAAVMAMLNKAAAETMAEFNVHACTDVTGFGLAGHLLEMAKGAKKKIVLDTQRVPLFGRALELASMGMVPAGAHKNQKYFEQWSQVDPAVERARTDLMFDPQTSGGLLISLASDQADACLGRLRSRGLSPAVVAEVAEDHPIGMLNLI